MRRWLPILATSLVLAAAAAGWFLLGDRPHGPAIPDEVATDADATPGDGATLAARGPAAAATASLDGRIRVTVTDAKGPVGGVRVTARRLGPAHDPNDPATWAGGDANARARRSVAEIDTPSTDAAPEVTATTGEQGTCDVAVSRPGSYAVRAEPAAPRWGSVATVSVTAERRDPPAALRVGEGTPLRGRVVDAQDRPVAARLRGSWPLPGGGTGEPWSAPRLATDPATGAFAWEAVPSGEGTVHVTVPGRISITLRVVTPRAEDLVIRLSPGGLVRGRVTDAAGTPVEGADVLASVVPPEGAAAAERGAVARARSGEDGTYRMDDVPPGRVAYVMTVAEGFRARTDSAPSAKWAPAEVAVGKETVLDVVLDRGSVIEGRVLVEGTGAPLPDARVHALVTQGRWNDRPEPVTTDEEGRFRFERLPVGRYVLAATSAGHYFEPFAPAEAVVSMVGGEAQLGDAVVAVIARDGERLEREIRMKPGLSVRGRVVGPDAAPVEGAKVTCSRLQPWNACWRWGVEQPNLSGSEATTAADGTFRLTGLPPGDAVTLSARKSPLTAPPTAPFRLAAGEPELDVVVTMETGATVTGRVLDEDGTSLGVTQVNWYSQDPGRQGNGQGMSEADGTFRLEGLPPTVVQVHTWVKGRNASAEVRPALSAGEVRSGVDLRLLRSVTISGVVVDAQGQPLKGIRLVAAPPEGGNYGAAVSRADGTFEILNLAERAYRVAVNASPNENAITWPTTGETVTAPASGVRVVAKARLETLVSGRVQLPDGGPVPLCTVRIAGGDREAAQYGRGNSDEVVGGEFRRTVNAAPPFPLEVSAASAADGRRLNLRPKRITVDKETTDLVITLEAGLALAGRVVDARGAPVAGARVVVGTAEQVVTDASGAFRMDGLSEGDVGLSVQPPPGFAAPAPLTVKAGTTDVVVTCPAGSAVTGRVLGPDGQPLTQGAVMASWAGGSAGGQIVADGAFRIEGIPVNAVVHLETNLWDPVGRALQPAKVDGVLAGTEGVVLRLETGASVAGVVVDADGRPLAGRYVTRVDPYGGNVYSSPTDAQGRFTLVGLAPGPVTLLVRDPNVSRAVTPPLRTEAPGTGVRIVVPRKATIGGRIAGTDVAKFVVSAHPAEAESAEPKTASAEVGADGRFTLEVWDGVPLTLSARRMNDDRYALMTPVRAGADVTLEPQPGLSIDGSLLLADGKPPPGAWLWARSPAWTTTARVGAEGAWRFRGLPPGTYRLVTSLGTAVPETSVEAGATGVRLTAR